MIPEAHMKQPKAEHFADSRVPEFTIHLSLQSAEHQQAVLQGVFVFACTLLAIPSLHNLAYF